MNTTRRMEKSCENYRGVANSDANVLPFHHVSQLCWKISFSKEKDSFEKETEKQIE